MVAYFAITLFVSAVLLFSVQPMIAKMLLPLLGGTPGVWNTCMVFFQAMLLAGYAYAHVLSTRFSVAAQKRVHLALMLVTCVALPIGLSVQAARSAPWDSNPFLWLLQVLFLVIALPFFTVSSSAPLLQRWFSHTRHRSARDPYFLYVASNLGSVMGLIAYPVLVEPMLRLQAQSRLWSAGYGLLVLLFAGCAFMTGSGAGVADAPKPGAAPSSRESASMDRGEVSGSRRLRWIFWAFIPSSLMLGVTSFFTTDIASVPLLWTVPLALYLVTFILAFSRRQVISQKRLMRVLPVSVVVLVFVMLAKSDQLAWLQIGVHLVFFFCAALLWHTRLADDRPSTRHLTEFYFCVSAGGVLGGLFNALLAPVIFRTIMEYRLLIALACIRWPDHETEGVKSRAFWSGLLWPAGIGVLTAGLAVMAPHLGLEPHLRTMAVFGVPVILCYVLSKQKRTLAFALAVGAVLAGSHFYTATQGRTLHVERNFFGTLRVTLDPTGRIHALYHGTTVHGMQFVDPDRQREPLAYFHRRGPCGQAMKAFNSRAGMTRVAVIGLGSGAMVCYAQPRQHWTFYEIDPAVIRLARQGDYFTYLRNCTNAVVDFRLGDARLRLREAAAGEFDLLVCDAFGSDAPPLHLLNREAMELYLSKLSPQGVLLFHVSSRYLDFEPVIANLAGHFQLQAFVGSEDDLSVEMLREGKLPSLWVALARRTEDLGGLATDPRWRSLAPVPGMRLWTDDYSNILGIFQWD